MRPNRSDSPPPRRPLPGALAQLLPAFPTSEHNLGLWLDRFLRRDGRDWTFTGQQRVDELRGFARNWEAPAAEQALARRIEGCRLVGQSGAPRGEGRLLLLRLRAKLASKLLLDHGRATAAELAVSVHGQWGAPRIAGSGIKGLCRAEAEIAGWDPVDLDDTFGRAASALESASAGRVDFLDALPEKGKFALTLDTLTPHHMDWNGGDNRWGPVEWESPVPVSFLAVASATYVFDLMTEGDLSDPVADAAAVARLRAAAAVLAEGLALPGLGGKTAAGYGIFEVLV